MFKTNILVLGSWVALLMAGCSSKDASVEKRTGTPYVRPGGGSAAGGEQPTPPPQIPEIEAAEWKRIAGSLLERQKVVQDHLQELNGKYDQLYEKVEDVEGRAKWLRWPKTEAEKAEGYVTGKTLDTLHSLQNMLTNGASQLKAALQSAQGQWTERLLDGRLLGMRVPEKTTLFNGPTLAVSKADKGGVGTLGSAIREVCFYDPNAQTVDGTDLFLNIHYRNTSCAMAPERVKLLSDPAESLNEKLELLGGLRLTQEQIERTDPFMKLDLSRAPELESIVMGYLEYKNDFSGNLVSQILRHHADRGTQIRIIVPDQPIPGTSFVHGPDRVLLKSLLAYSKNIQIQFFRLGSRNPDVTSIGSFIEHSYHAKAIAVIAKTPGKSGAIVGGRNIKDTFYLKDAPDFSQRPDLIQYGAGGEPYALFHDLEIAAYGREVAEQVTAQVMAFWHRDTLGPKMRRMTEHYPVLEAEGTLREALRARAKKQNFIRFFYSAPYIDDRELVKTYVDFINVAKRKLRIVSPYVRPVKEVAKALRAAALRGVDIDFVTNLSYQGDNSPSFTGDVNKVYFNDLTEKNLKDIAENEDANRVIGRVKIWSWEGRGLRPAPIVDGKMPSILHAKAMVVDEDLIYVGSANFDNRTFLHDTENGFLATGELIPAYIKLFDQTYIPGSELMVGKQKTAFLSKLIIPLLDLLKVD